jgi:hypothetical protein
VTASARERTGWAFYDWASQVFRTSVVTVFLSLYLTGVAEADARASGQACPGGTALVDCDVSLLGVPVAAGSLYGYLVAIATLVQVVVLPVAGAIADRTQDKRGMLGLFAFTGAAATVVQVAVLPVAGARSTRWASAARRGWDRCCSPWSPTRPARSGPRSSRWSSSSSWAASASRSFLSGELSDRWVTPNRLACKQHVSDR